MSTKITSFPLCPPVLAAALMTCAPLFTRDATAQTLRSSRPLAPQIPLKRPATGQSTLPPTSPNSNAAANDSVANVADLDEQIDLGQSLAEEGEEKSLAILGTASQNALTMLATLGGNALLTAPPERMPELGALGEAARRAARAHLAWGIAADKFARRDLAITALTRAYRLAGPNRLGTNRLAHAASLALGSIGREGLPQIAPDDALDTLASMGLWKPRRFHFDWNSNALKPISALPTALSSAPKPKSAGQSTLAASKAIADAGGVDLLVTEGALFPPALDSSAPNDDKAVIAPLYRDVAAERLPPVLKLGYMVAGYARETSGADRGLWKQVVRVFYAHPILTRNNRDDRPRAEALAAQFLKVHALLEAATGLSNRYTRDGVTTLWLSEVSALWPTDDDDADVQQEMGIRMPKPNVPLSPEEKLRQSAEVEWSPLSRPWLAAASIDMAPGDIQFFRVGQNRPEAEWLREIAHEYGHVALPPIGGFRAPLEPFGNGLIGETLAMTWIGAAAGGFENVLPPLRPAEATMADASFDTHLAAIGEPKRLNDGTSSRGPSMRDAALNHVARNAIPALRLWNAQGPNSPLRRDGARLGLQYVQGLSVYVERVYGAPILGAAYRPLIERSTSNFNRASAAIVPTDTPSFMANISTVLRDPFAPNTRVLSIWLPGALENLPADLSPQALCERTPMALRAGERSAATLFVPAAARKLRVEWKPNVPGAVLRAEGFASNWVTPQMTGAGGALEIEVGGRGGWNRFSFLPDGSLTIVGAAFVK